MTAPAVIPDLTGSIEGTSGANSLLSLIANAAAALEGARTLAETLSAMKLAQAANELGRIAGAADDVRADCLRIMVLAQMRIAREYDAAKAKGEVAGHGRSAAEAKVRDADLSLPTTEEMGLDKRRIAEWRKMADAGEEVVLGAIENALDEGREATAADVMRAVSGGPVCRYFSGNVEWYTPSEYVEAARQALGGAIDLDPASCEKAQKTAQAGRYFTQEDCGLSRQWHGRVWLNPPYAIGLIDRFANKLLAEYAAGNVSAAVVLTDNRTDTAWFHALAGACSRLCFTRRRIHFYNDSVSVSRPANGSSFFYFGRSPGAFAAAFAWVGLGCEVAFTQTLGVAADLAAERACARRGYCGTRTSRRAGPADGRPGLARIAAGPGP